MMDLMVLVRSSRYDGPNGTGESPQYMYYMCA